MSTNTSGSARGPKVSREELRQNFLNQGLFDIDRPIVLFNKATLDVYADAIPPQLLAASGESADEVQRAVATPDDLGPFSLTLDQRARFQNGEPVLIQPAVFEHRAKRESGGQINDAVEKEIKSALAATVYAVVEQVRHLLFVRDQRTYPTQDASREVVIQELTAQWPQDGSHKDEESRRKHLDTLWSKGRRPGIWRRLFVVDSLGKSAKRWASHFSRTERGALNNEIDFQKSSVQGLLHSESRAARLRKTIGEVSRKVAKGGEETQGQRAILSATTPDQHRRPVDVAPVAFAGDINPADIYPNLSNAETREYFETLRVLGRFARGQSVEFTKDHMLYIHTGIKTLERWMAKPWREDTNEAKEHAFWAKTLRSIMSHDEWLQFFCEGYPITKEGGLFQVQRQLP